MEEGKWFSKSGYGVKKGNNIRDSSHLSDLVLGELKLHLSRTGMAWVNSFKFPLKKSKLVGQRETLQRSHAQPTQKMTKSTEDDFCNANISPSKNLMSWTSNNLQHLAPRCENAAPAT